MPAYTRDTDVGIVYDIATNAVLRVYVPDPGTPVPITPLEHGVGFYSKRVPAGVDFIDFCASLGLKHG